jgi:hypothetical protein
MSESQLQRDWKERDVQRMRNIITKDYSAKTGVQVGYTAGYVERKEGDVWEENGKQWTIKNGLKQTITRFDELKRKINMPLTCPNCKKPMTKGRSDKYMYSIHQMCLDCVIEHEAQLKREGTFGEYQINIIRQGAKVHIKEMEDALLELLMDQSNDSFVTEAGDIETWKGKDEGKQQLIQEIQEYIQNLKDAIGPQYL